MENENKRAAIEFIEREKKIFMDVSDDIGAHPELSLKEFHAAELYAEVLEKHGFQVEKGFGGIATAVKGSFGSGRPVIGILGEYDALDGLSQAPACPERREVVPGGPGHGCGHNMLGAGSLAAAFAVKNYLQRTGRPGTVEFYGCPGEEGGAAKAFFGRDRLWERLDAALTWHPKDANEVVSGSNNACIQILYRFHGTAAHAAGDPENGRSALDAVELMNTGVQYLREHMTSDCRIHYAITDTGGVSPNVVQDHAAVLYMVRAAKVRDAVKLLARVDKIAAGAALMTETENSRQFIDGTAELVPNYTLEKLLYENFEAVGLPSYTAEELMFAEQLAATCPTEDIPGFASTLDPEIAARVEKMRAETAAAAAANQASSALAEGTTAPETATAAAANQASLTPAEVSGQPSAKVPALNNFLVPLYHTTAFQAGSTDVGDVSWQTPTAQIHTAGFVNGAPGHSWQNVASGGSSIGHKALLLAGKVLACAAIDLYEKPELLAAAREEFRKRTKSGYVCPIEEGAVPIAL